MKINLSFSFVGCLKCFCYGVSETCAAAELGVESMAHAEGWKVMTDNWQVYLIYKVFW